MDTVLGGLPQRARIAVVRLRSLGDCVLTTPALQLIQQARPDCQIGVVVENRFAPVFTDNPGIASVLPPVFGALRAFRPYFCINLHGGSRSLWLTLASGAKLRAGFAHFRYSGLYHARIPRAQEILGEERKVHTAEHLASAAFFLGAPRTPIPRALLYCPDPPLRPPYAVLHPVASAPQKTWPAAKFLQLARHLQNSEGLEVFVIGAASDDLRPFSGLPIRQGLPLKQVMTLLKGASLFAGNDSGPAHIAAAFGVPAVVLFGNSDEQVWYPWRTASRVLKNSDDIAAIPVERVAASIAELRQVTA